MKSCLIIILCVFSIAHGQLQTRGGCVPSCNCERNKTTGIYQIICDDFPTSPLPPDLRILQSRRSPTTLQKSAVEPLRPDSIDTVDFRDSGVAEIEDGALTLFTSLTIIKLSFNNIKTISANTFSGCGKLVEIDLDNNEITNLGDQCFSILPKLRVLQLQHNKIRTLPPLPQSLNTLDISHNNLNTMNGYTFKGAIKYLDVCANQIKQVPGACFALATQLESICLPSLPPMNRQGTKGSPSRASLSNVRNLTLTATDFSPNLSETDMERIPQLPNLETLSIIGYNLTSVEFLKNPNLKSLKLENVWLAGGLEKEWLEALTNLMALTRLDLENSPQLAQILLEDNLVWNHLYQLRYLNLHNCAIFKLGRNIKPGNSTLYVDLSVNPLECDCDLLITLRNGLSLVGYLTQTLCHSPLEHQGKNPFQVPSQLCQENPKKTSPSAVRGFEDNPDDTAIDFPDSNPIAEGKEELKGMHPSDPHHTQVENPGSASDEMEPNGPVTLEPEEDGDEEDTSSVYWEDKESGAVSGKISSRDRNIIIAVVVIALVAAIIISILFFYFRRRGSANVGHESASYRKEATSRDNLVKTKK